MFTYDYEIKICLIFFLKLELFYHVDFKVL